MLPFCRAPPADDGIQVDAVDAAEDVHIHLGVIPAEAGDELLDLLALGLAGLVPGGDLLGKAAGALQKGEVVIIFPGDDIPFPHQVQGADKLHTGEI